MAISPNHLNDAFIEEVNYYERAFDKQLAKEKITKGGSITISNVPMGYTMGHHKMIVERYKAAGWKDVEYNSDQRDGEWMVFKS